jgi:hypothetical protein
MRVRTRLGAFQFPEPFVAPLPSPDTGGAGGAGVAGGFDPPLESDEGLSLETGASTPVVALGADALEPSPRAEEVPAEEPPLPELSGPLEPLEPLDPLAAGLSCES